MSGEIKVNTKELQNQHSKIDQSAKTIVASENHSIQEGNSVALDKFCEMLHSFVEAVAVYRERLMEDILVMHAAVDQMKEKDQTLMQ